MLDRMTEEEFLTWQAFERFEPFGSLVEDYRHGRLIQAQTGEHWLNYFTGYHPIDIEWNKKVLKEFEDIKFEQERQAAINQQIATVKAISMINAQVDAAEGA